MKKIGVIFLVVAAVNCAFAAGKSLEDKHLPGIDEGSVPMVPPPYQMVETPKENSADRKLSEQVQKELKAQVANYNPEKNMIITQKGAVTLQGKAASPEEAQKILQIVRKVKGVSKVRNKMVVQSAPQN